MFALTYTLDGRTERLLLATGDTTVGRSALCDLVIADPSISRRHARFRVHGEHCLLTDLGGRNGTFVNGDLVSEVEVHAGDTITLGRFPVVLEHADDEETAPGGELLSASPVTIAHPVTDLAGDGATWRLSVDTARLFALMSTLARHVLHWKTTQDLMEQIVDAAFDAVPVERVFLLLPDGPDRRLTAFVARTRTGESVPATQVNRPAAARVMTQRVALLSRGTSPGSSRGAMGRPEPVNRWFIATPLCRQDGTTGVLYADNPEAVPLTAADLDLLHALGRYATAAIDQAKDTDRFVLTGTATEPVRPASDADPGGSVQKT
jgi:hypothetical protein